MRRDRHVPVTGANQLPGDAFAGQRGARSEMVVDVSRPPDSERREQSGGAPLDTHLRRGANNVHLAGLRRQRAQLAAVIRARKSRRGMAEAFVGERESLGRRPPLDFRLQVLEPVGERLVERLLDRAAEETRDEPLV
jgi:hypothetical protein